MSLYDASHFTHTQVVKASNILLWLSSAVDCFVKVRCVSAADGWRQQRAGERKCASHMRGTHILCKDSRPVGQNTCWLFHIAPSLLHTDWTTNPFVKVWRQIFTDLSRSLHLTSKAVMFCWRWDETVINCSFHNDCMTNNLSIPAESIDLHMHYIFPPLFLLSNWTVYSIYPSLYMYIILQLHLNFRLDAKLTLLYQYLRVESNIIDVFVIKLWLVKLARLDTLFPLTRLKGIFRWEFNPWSKPLWNCVRLPLERSS